MFHLYFLSGHSFPSQTMKLNKTVQPIVSEIKKSVQRINSEIKESTLKIRQPMVRFNPFHKLKQNKQLTSQRRFRTDLKVVN
jgi:hypothetical protein